MKQTPLKRKTPLRAYKGLTVKSRLKPTSKKIAKRNGNWKLICMERAKYLIKKYGVIICEYSGETIRCLSSVPNDLDDGWGHHIDGNRDNCEESNCYIIKYKYHRIIEDSNIQVKQEGFEGKHGTV